jgi:hypothetical protein
VRVDASDASDHSVGGHGRCSVLPIRARGYPSADGTHRASIRRAEHDRAARRRPRQATR